MTSDEMLKADLPQGHSFHNRAKLGDKPDWEIVPKRSPRRLTMKSIAGFRIHRQGGFIGLRLGDGETAYIPANMARDIAEQLNSYAINVIVYPTGPRFNTAVVEVSGAGVFDIDPA